MGYRLIALDIDGTLRSEEYPISDRTRTAVKAAADRGAAVTVATGRMYPSVAAVTSRLEITAPIVSFQGAHIADPATGDVLWHRPLVPQMALEALEALHSWEGEVLAYHGDRVYVDKLTPWAKDYVRRNRGRAQVVPDLRPLAARELTRLTAVGQGEKMDGLVLRLKRSLDSRLNIVRSLPHFCEILHPDTGKHKALSWLSHHLAIRREEAIAFGNGPEDAEMLRWAGLGEAVRGAQREVVESADLIAPPIEEDGVAQVLEDLVARGLVG